MLYKTFCVSETYESVAIDECHIGTIQLMILCPLKSEMKKMQEDCAKQQDNIDETANEDAGLQKRSSTYL